MKFCNRLEGRKRADVQLKLQCRCIELHTGMIKVHNNEAKDYLNSYEVETIIDVAF